MNYSNFVLLVFGIYIIYYAINITYDSFFKRSNQQELSDSEEEIIMEDEEMPHEVLDDEVEDSTKKKVDESQEEEEEDPQIVMEVETQGIPLEELMTKGKGMFAGVRF